MENYSTFPALQNIVSYACVVCGQYRDVGSLLDLTSVLMSESKRKIKMN